MGGRVCSVCASPSTAAITKEIMAGVSYREIASHFDVTFHAAARHAQKCLQLRRKEKKAATVPERTDRDTVSRNEATELEPSSLLRRASRLLDATQAIIDRARASGDDRLGLSAQRELRESLNLAMKAIGMMQDGGNVYVDQRKIELRTNIGELSVEHLRALAEGRVAITGDSIDAEVRPC